MEKTLLSLGTLSLIILPIASVASCNLQSTIEENTKFEWLIVTSKNDSNNIVRYNISQITMIETDTQNGKYIKIYTSGDPGFKQYSVDRYDFKVL